MATKPQLQIHALRTLHLPHNRRKQKHRLQHTRTCLLQHHLWQHAPIRTEPHADAHTPRRPLGALVANHAGQNRQPRHNSLRRKPNRWHHRHASAKLREILSYARGNQSTVLAFSKATSLAAMASSSPNCCPTMNRHTCWKQQGCILSRQRCSGRRIRGAVEQGKHGFPIGHRQGNHCGAAHGSSPEALGNDLYSMATPKHCGSPIFSAHSLPTRF